MELCAKCQEIGKDEKAEYSVWAVAYFNPELSKFIPCQNDGAKVCKPCLDFTLSLTNVVRVKYELLEVAQHRADPCRKAGLGSSVKINKKENN